MAGSKALWRKWALTQQFAVDSGRLVAGIEGFLAGFNSAAVLTYASMATEADLSRIQHSGQLLLTRTPNAGWLTIHPASSERELHRWGFSQPVATSTLVAPEDVDVVLVPGALFDRRGGRLGHGKGYYDELLSRCRIDVVRVGVTSEQGLVESLPTEPHDVVMTHLATELGVRPVLAQSP